jgi:hypothetical protein
MLKVKSQNLKLSKAFIPRLSIKLHLKIWNNFYSYTNASPDEVKQVKEIYGWEESKNMKKEVQ